MVMTLREVDIYSSSYPYPPGYLRVFHLSSQSVLEEVAGVLPTQPAYYGRSFPREFYTTVDGSPVTHFLLKTSETEPTCTVRLQYDSSKFNVPKLPDQGSAKAYVYVGTGG